MNDKVKNILIICFFYISTTFANADENQFNFYVGNFDFSDDGKKSTLFGIEHQNPSLAKDSIIGEISIPPKFGNICF